MDTKYYRQALAEFIKKAMTDDPKFKVEISLNQLSWILTRAQQLKENECQPTH
jgi:hypothetical protein